MSADFSVSVTPAGEGADPDRVALEFTRGGDPFVDVELEPEAFDWVVDHFGDVATKILFKYL